MANEIRDICRKTYQEFVKSQPIPDELKRALRSHERVPVFIDNLAREFQALKFPVKRETIEQAVRDLTQYFIIGVKVSAEARVASPIAVAMKKAEETKRKEFREAADALERLGVDHVTQTTQGETHTQVVDAETLEKAGII